MNNTVENAPQSSVNSGDNRDTLIRAVFATQAGDKAEARRLLDMILAADPGNEQAWLCMSGVVDGDDERIACLERVLARNPGNERARRGLATLGKTPPPYEDSHSPVSSERGGLAPTVPGARRNCPHLGRSDDRDTSLLYPHQEHRCYATGKARRIDEDHQEAYCLGGPFQTCPRYVEPAQRRPAAPSVPPAQSALEHDIPGGVALGVLATAGDRLGAGRRGCCVRRSALRHCYLGAAAVSIPVAHAGRCRSFADAHLHTLCGRDVDQRYAARFYAAHADAHAAARRRELRVVAGRRCGGLGSQQ